MLALLEAKSRRAPWAYLLAIALVGVPATAKAPELTMLSQLEKGSWELRHRQDGSRERICVRTGQEFIQLRHRQRGCSRFVVKDTPNEVTVQYTCKGNDYGRTTVRSEGSGLVQIRSQGISDGTPFVLDGEARQQGAC